MKKVNKRGLSPVITTVLLLVIVLAAVIFVFIWLLRFLPESIVKRDPVTKEEVDAREFCKEVSFQAGYNGSDILLSNTGNVPIYAFNIEQVIGGGASTVVHEAIREDIGPGGSGKITSGELGLDSDASKLIIRPVLLGRRGEVREPYPCVNHPGISIELP